MTELPSDTTDPVPADSSPPDADDGAGPPSRLRGVLTAVTLCALVAGAAIGGNVVGLRDDLFGGSTPKPLPAATSRDGQGVPAVPTSTAGATVLRSQPWWQGVRTVDGSGPSAVNGLTIGANAIQWRATWTCDAGHLTVRAGGRPKALIDAACPRKGTGYATQTGVVNLDVVADGPWHLQVEQEVDVPLVEPPLAAMSDPGTVVASRGDLYRIDQNGSGQVTLYRLPDETYALRFDNFFISPNVDLEVRFSPLPAPHSTDEYLGSPSVKVAPLDITTGSLNFVVPPDVAPSQYQSVVIWCPLVKSAYAAATMR